ncbi:DUF2834 domain-containing protein [Pseudoalteromonas phenolica]|uniref:DUF2834 domain-containing protein n=1 Tax=Pseudoalteromonas phenolica TaxID=161398 RepID=UPI00110AB04F|nr:DUF2834 domain-containing protein [Pseudoalteromonas phenolica]TMO57226.1 hypothetical protein CWC21_04925 [Pseudoalteromonas phenolica]
MAKVYLLLAILGAVLPYGALLPWLFDNGLNLQLLWQAITANNISVLAWLDVVIAAVALICFIVTDSNKHQVRGAAFAIIATLTVGVACGLPLYLYLKEKNREVQIKA